MDALFQVIFSNGFPRLRLCTAVGITPLVARDTWSSSPALRFLHLDMQTREDYERLFYVCPNLRRFTSYGPGWTGSVYSMSSSCFSKNMYNSYQTYLITMHVVTVLERLIFLMQHC